MTSWVTVGMIFPFPTVSGKIIQPCHVPNQPDLLWFLWDFDGIYREWPGNQYVIARQISELNGPWSIAMFFFFFIGGDGQLGVLLFVVSRTWGNWDNKDAAMNCYQLVSGFVLICVWQWTLDTCGLFSSNKHGHIHQRFRHEAIKPTRLPHNMVFFHQDISKV